ncbi:hypothetical protein DSO57_1018322 [Entomophthora muscae]|uniref:Uncharacterized protein n=1 Tax=Entomophthora muscae TaxID=34485 RepID=A0ACC2S6C6_9FUNG|nr:hypothetical protein DSO57_1018322 [Entomophthora muscae]
MFEDIPGRAQDILATSKNVYSALNLAPSVSPSLESPMPSLSVDPGVQVQEYDLDGSRFLLSPTIFLTSL